MKGRSEEQVPIRIELTGVARSIDPRREKFRSGEHKDQSARSAGLHSFDRACRKEAGLLDRSLGTFSFLAVSFAHLAVIYL